MLFRSERYKEPEVCRVYSKKEKVRQYLPILDWTSEDISEFVSERGIKCHPLYYDEHGNFHPERRLGCMCCPLKSKRLRLREFEQYPKMIKFYIWGGKSILKRIQMPNAKHTSTTYMSGLLLTSSAIRLLSSESVLVPTSLMAV